MTYLNETLDIHFRDLFQDGEIKDKEEKAG